MVYHSEEKAFDRVCIKIKKRLDKLRKKYPDCDFIAKEHITSCSYTLSEKERLFGYKLIQEEYSWKTEHKCQYKEYIEIPVLDKMKIEEVREGEYKATPEYKNVSTGNYVIKEGIATELHTKYVAIAYKYVESGTEEEVLAAEEEIWKNEEARGFCSWRGTMSPEIYHKKRKAEMLSSFIKHVFISMLTIFLLSLQFYFKDFKYVTALTFLGISVSFITYLLYSIEDDGLPPFFVGVIIIFFIICAIICAIRTAIGTTPEKSLLIYYLLGIGLSIVMMIVYTVKMIDRDLALFYVEFPMVIGVSLLSIINWSNTNIFTLLFYIIFACSVILFLLRIKKNIEHLIYEFKYENRRAQEEINGNYSEKELHEKYIKIMSYIKS